MTVPTPSSLTPHSTQRAEPDLQPAYAGTLAGTRRSSLRWLAQGAGSAALLCLAGCALLPWSAQAPTVHVVGLERVAGQALERRLQVQLRIQNPNPRAIDFKGLTLSLDLNNRLVAQGVSPEQGAISAHGELLMSVPVTVSAAPETLQMLGFADSRARGELPYTVRGRFTGGTIAQVLGTEAVFESSGSVRLPR